MMDFASDIFTALKAYEDAGFTKAAWDEHVKPLKNAIQTARAFPLKFLETGDFHRVARFARPDGSGDFELRLRVEGTSAWGCLIQLDTANEKRDIWFDADAKEPHRRRPIRLGETFF
jgi:hypothetical protein